MNDTLERSIRTLVQAVLGAVLAQVAALGLDVSWVDVDAVSLTVGSAVVGALAMILAAVAARITPASNAPSA